MTTAVAGPSQLPLPRDGRDPSPSTDIDSRRTSLVSGSAVSFHTAKSNQSRTHSEISLESSVSTSSGHTVGAPGKKGETDVGPLHILSGAQGIHVVKMSEATVEVHTGSRPDPLLQRMAGSVPQGVPYTPLALHAGPPPPSPPPSRDGDETSTIQRSPSPKLTFTRSEPVPLQSSARPSFEPPRKRSFGSAAQPTLSTRVDLPSTSDSVRKRPSTETRTSVRSVTDNTSYSSPRVDPATPSTSEHPPSISTDRQGSLSASPPSIKSSHMSMDGYLQPPSSHRPARRNTTGSSATALSTRPSRSLTHQYQGSSSAQQRGFAYEDTDAYMAGHMAAHAQMLGLTPAAGGTGLGFGELDSDILMQADQIRRERITKRRHQEQQEAEMAALTKATSKEDNNVLVGNLIGEDHVNYVMMYNMLTGIRTSVSNDTTLFYHTFSLV